MSNRWLGVAVLGVTLAGAVAFRGSAAASRSRGAQLDRELDELRRGMEALRQSRMTEAGESLDTLEQKLSDLERKQNELRQPRTTVAGITSALAAPSATPVRPATLASLQEDRINRTRELIDQYAAKLDEVIDSEPVDTEWRNATLSDARHNFAALTTSRILNADCGTNLCRIEVENDSASAQRHLATELQGRAPFDQEMLYRYDDKSNPPRVTLYVARTGTELRTLLKDGTSP